MDITEMANRRGVTEGQETRFESVVLHGTIDSVKMSISKEFYIVALSMGIGNRGNVLVHFPVNKFSSSCFQFIGERNIVTVTAKVPYGTASIIWGEAITLS